MKKLHISRSLALPLDFVTSTQAILAKKGKGKTYKASVQAEELLDAGQQVVAIDPTGAWWGLRSSADGKSNGYPIAILGGEHADVPLEPTAGEVIADAIATEHFSAVIDLTLFRKGEALRFMAAFLETLYRKNREALHLFIDEADVVAPQKTFGPDEARVLGATEDIVRRGRIRGIGCTLITQRPQVLNKNVLSQVDMLTALGMNHPKDIGAIKEWVAVHGDEAQAKQMIADLPALPQGEAWVWAPAADIFKRVTFRDRHTFDSGRTPKAGERKLVPKVLAPVDIARLGQTIAATVEEKKASDPKALRTRIAELEKQLAAKPSGKVSTKTVEKSVIKPDHLTRIEKQLARGESLGDRLEKQIHELETWRAQLGQDLNQLRAVAAIAKQPPTTNAAIAAAHFAQDGKAPKLVGKHVIRARPAAPAVGEARGPLPDGSFTGAQRELLAALAWWRAVGHERPTKAQVAAKAGWKVKGSHLRNRLSELRTHGVIEQPSGGRIALTPEGVAIAPPPNTNETLLDSIRATLTGAQRELFDVLVDGRPRSRPELAEAVGWDPTGSHLRNRVSELKARELVDYPSRAEVVVQSWVIDG